MAAQQAAEAAFRRRWFARVAGAAASRFGIPGIATAGAGPAGLAIAGVATAMLLLTRTIRALNQAMEDARRRYARQLQTGLPGGFTTTRGVMAEILGVSEQEVLRYGKAVNWLTERVRLSSAELNRTTRTLTAAAINWKVVGLNFRALWAQLATALSEVSNIIAKAVSAWVEFIRESGHARRLTQLLAVALQLLSAAMIGIMVPVAAVITALTALGDAFEYFFRQVKNSFARTFGGKIDISDKFKETKAAAKALVELIKSLGKSSASEKVPAATSDYRRLEPSPWERMGLVIGQGIGGNPLRKIEQHTKRTADLLQKALPRTASPMRLAAANPNSV